MQRKLCWLFYVLDIAAAVIIHLIDPWVHQPDLCLQTQLAREGRIRSASHKHSIPVGTENNIALKRVFKNYCKYALGQGRVYQQVRGVWRLPSCT